MSEHDQENNGTPKGLMNKTLYFTGFACGKVRNVNNRITGALNWKKVNEKTKETIKATRDTSIKIADSFKKGTSEVAESFIAGIKSVKDDNLDQNEKSNIPADREIIANLPDEKPSEQSEIIPDKEISTKDKMASALAETIDDVKLNYDLEKEIEKIDKVVTDL